MESSRHTGASQFSIRTLLIVIAVSAIGILVGTSLYQNRLRQTGASAVTKLLITPTAAADTAWLDTSKLRELLLADAGFLHLKVIKASENPKAWLYKHLVFDREASLPDKIILSVSINLMDQELAVRDIDAVLQATTSAINSKAAESKTEVLVLSKTFYQYAPQ